MSSTETIKMLTRYKAWANEGLLSALMSDPEVEVLDDISYIIGILNHAHVVDCIFQAHLKGVAHPFKGLSTPALPTLGELCRSIQIVDQWYVDYADSTPEEKLEQIIEFQFINGENGKMSRAEIILHTINHSTYHRGNIGVLLQQNGIIPNKDVLTNFLDEARITY